MHHSSRKLISIVIPCYNEAGTIETCLRQLKNTAEADQAHDYEFIFVNDGSHDDTLARLQSSAETDPRVRILSFTRNFGKELATTAGINASRGNATIVMDADGQHPFSLIPEFIRRWQQGARVVIGVRSNTYRGHFKNFTSRMFYRSFNSMADTHLEPGATDFRLIDRSVREQFSKLTERSRITRGLIDWLGYQPEYVAFQMPDRAAGDATYSYGKLVGLATNSFVSLSLKPLYLMSYSGLAVLLLSVLLGLFSVTEMLIGDPMGLHITGTAYLVLLVLFLLGIILISQGVLALYISHIHTESKNRPMYVIDERESRL
jgi:glycosyltransferase involved in cell wall biosynthesis